MESHTPYNNHTLPVTLPYLWVSKVRSKGLPMAIRKYEYKNPYLLVAGHSSGTKWKDEELVMTLEMSSGVI